MLVSRLAAGELAGRRLFPPWTNPNPGGRCLLTHSKYGIRNVILITSPCNQAA